MRLYGLVLLGSVATAAAHTPGVEQTVVDAARQKIYSEELRRFCDTFYAKDPKDWANECFGTGTKFMQAGVRPARLLHELCSMLKSAANAARCYLVGTQIWTEFKPVVDKCGEDKTTFGGYWHYYALEPIIKCYRSEFDRLSREP